EKAGTPRHGSRSLAIVRVTAGTESQRYAEGSRPDPVLLPTLPCVSEPPGADIAHHKDSGHPMTLPGASLECQESLPVEPYCRRDASGDWAMAKSNRTLVPDSRSLGSRSGVSPDERGADVFPGSTRGAVGWIFDVLRSVYH